ncbi:MAG TPA: ABC transporter permease [Stellaceae bacterium]|nr:ABC transporter permease [Stellaceae bacterium]
MKRFIARRVGYALLSLFLLSLTIFFFVRVTGDPAALLVEPGASPGDIAAIHHQFGLDRPLLVQYWLFLVALFHGDLGQSFYYQVPVMGLYLSRLGNSLILASVAMLFSLAIGIPAGILASVQVGRFWDQFGKLFTLLGLSMPSFWIGLLMILLFSVYLGWLPSSGAGSGWQLCLPFTSICGSGEPTHIIMPAFALGWYFAAAHMRLTRSSMLEVLGSEYIKLARIKGLPQILVIAKHAFKNALIPVLTLAGINLVLMVNVAVVVETVFAWPGIGRLLYEGITFRDFPIVQGVVIMGGAMIVIVNLLIDIIYAVIDPRIRLGN